MTTNLSVPQIEKNIANLGKGIKRSRGMSKAGKLATIVATAVTIGIGANNLKNDEQAVQENTAVPAAVALAGFGTALGAGKSRKNKSITLQEAQAELETAKEKEAEEKRLAEEERQKEIRKAAELEEAQKAEEKAKTRLYDDLQRLPNQEEFCFNYELNNFGVVDKKPFQKEGGDWKTGKPVPGRNYAEYYKTKDGCTVVAGIDYATVPQGVDCKDYTYRYVRVIDPKVKDVVCERGQLGCIDKEGFAVSLKIEKVLSSYEKDWKTGKEVRTYRQGSKYCVTPSSEKVACFPPYEQQVREQVMANAMNSLVGWQYTELHYSPYQVFDAKNGQRISKNSR